MKRRSWLLATAGLAAAGAGLGWQHWREQRFEQATGGLWRSRFQRPDGSPLDMAALRGRPLVLNFWGTWCPPCVEEMPALDRFQREFAAKGWQVVGLAIDNPSAVRGFLAKNPVGYTIGLAGFEGSELTRRLGNTQGSLPFTLVFDRRGEVARRKLGQTHFEELTGWAEGL